MSTNEVDRAIHANLHEVAPALLALPEDQWFERKSSRVSAKDLAITISAFANAEGGVVIVGLHDGTIEGLELDGARFCIGVLWHPEADVPGSGRPLFDALVSSAG